MSTNGPALESKSSQVAAMNRPPLVRLEDVVKYYPNGNVTAVNHVSLSIMEGEYAVIMGPSGCGKSTLLNLMGALDTPTSGEVYFREQPLSKHLSLDRFRSKEIGFVFQAFHLLPTLSALENVQIPMFGTSLSVAQRVARSKELLAMVNMSHRATSMPQGLSIGERQRVAIARALANDPAILLADEPTGNLDSKNGEDVLAIFRELHEIRKMTLVVITHSDEVAEQAERVIRLKDGRIDRIT